MSSKKSKAAKGGTKPPTTDKKKKQLVEPIVPPSGRIHKYFSATPPPASSLERLPPPPKSSPTKKVKVDAESPSTPAPKSPSKKKAASSPAPTATSPSKTRVNKSSRSSAAAADHDEPTAPIIPPPSPAKTRTPKSVATLLPSPPPITIASSRKRRTTPTRETEKDVADADADADAVGDSQETATSADDEPKRTTKRHKSQPSPKSSPKKRPKKSRRSIVEEEADDSTEMKVDQEEKVAVDEIPSSQASSTTTRNKRQRTPVKQRSFVDSQTTDTATEDVPQPSPSHTQAASNKRQKTSAAASRPSTRVKPEEEAEEEEKQSESTPIKSKKSTKKSTKLKDRDTMEIDEDERDSDIEELASSPPTSGKKSPRTPKATAAALTKSPTVSSKKSSTTAGAIGTPTLKPISMLNFEKTKPIDSEAMEDIAPLLASASKKTQQSQEEKSAATDKSIASRSKSKSKQPEITTIDDDTDVDSITPINSKPSPVVDDLLNYFNDVSPQPPPKSAEKKSTNKSDLSSPSKSRSRTPPVADTTPVVTTAATAPDVPSSTSLSSTKPSRAAALKATSAITESFKPPPTAVKTKATLGLTLPQKPPMGDPLVLLTNLLASHELMEFHETFQPKMAMLLNILTDESITCWTPGLLIQLYLQLQMAWLHSQFSNKAQRSDFAFLPVLPPFEKDLLNAPWTQANVPCFVHILRTITRKLQPFVKHVSNTNSASASAAASSSSSSSTINPELLTPVVQDRLKTILQLFVSRFSLPQFYGSYSMNEFPTIFQQAHYSYFEVCVEFLHVVLQPLLALPTKEIIRLHEWTLKIFVHEQKMRKEEQAAYQLHSNESEASVDEGDEQRHELVASTINCCHQCSFQRGSLPYPTLTLPARLAHNLFVRSYHMEDMQVDTAQALHKLLQQNISDLTIQLSLVGFVQPAIFRAHFIGLTFLQLFDKLTVPQVFYKHSLGDLDQFTTSSHTHKFLLAEFEFAFKFLKRLQKVYQDRVIAERSRRNTLKRELKFRGGDAEAKTVWGSCVVTKPPTRQRRSIQPSLTTSFARQELNQNQEKKEKELTPQDITAAAQQAKLAAEAKVHAENEALIVQFKQFQQNYAHLLAMYSQAISEQVHQHQQMCHPRIDPEAPTSVPSEVIDLSTPTSVGSSSCTDSTMSQPEPMRTTSETSIPDSQPESQQADSLEFTELKDDDQVIEETPPASGEQYSQSSDLGSVATAASKQGRHKVAPIPPQPCHCSQIEQICEHLRTKYQEFHQQVHQMQAEILIIVIKQK